MKKENKKEKEKKLTTANFEGAAVVGLLRCSINWADCILYSKWAVKRKVIGKIRSTRISFYLSKRVPGDM